MPPLLFLPMLPWPVLRHPALRAKHPQQHQRLQRQEEMDWRRRRRLERDRWIQRIIGRRLHEVALY